MTSNLFVTFALICLSMILVKIMEKFMALLTRKGGYQEEIWLVWQHRV